MKPEPAAEWPTLIIAAGCYAGFGAVTILAEGIGLIAAVPLLAIVLAQHASLQHEVLHGHPFKSQALNDLVVLPAIGLLIPYERFRDTHLAHHAEVNLTDPRLDPESNFVDPARWAGFSGPRKALYAFNNTLAGRMLVGPGLSLTSCYAQDFKALAAGNRNVRHAYAMHVLGLIPVALWQLSYSTLPVWAYVLAAYLGLSLLKIRTFLEHRAHETASGRNVIIEDRGPLALLFLNNNFHAVHHAHPRLAWYRLPAAYKARRAEFLKRNGSYRYRSYVEVFRKYLFRAKDTVAHPLWPAPPSATMDEPRHSKHRKAQSAPRP